jgi:precorrin-2 dehydrogenase/sirohydrochlorin ferrochelatase
MSMTVNYFPVFLNLKGKKAVVIGGGKVSERKATSLVKAGAAVTVISPILTKTLLKEKLEGRIRHLSRTYRKNDLKGAFLVVAATDSSDINKKVAKDAPALVNVVDSPSECNFIAPSVVKRGHLIIAVSTSGTSPALSKAIRSELQSLFDSEFSGYLSFIKKLRAKALLEIKEKKKSARFLKSLADDKTLNTLRAKGLYAVKKTVLDRFEKLKKK